METEFRPNYAIHPGVILKEDLKAIRMSQKELSRVTGIHSTIINEIIKGKRNINADDGLKISLALSFPDDYYFGLQNFYDLTLARLKKEEQDNSKNYVQVLQVNYNEDSNSLIIESFSNNFYFSSYIMDKNKEKNYGNAA